MIKKENEKYFVHTKVRGISGAAVPGKYFGYQGKINAKIHAQPLIREIAINPETVDYVIISNMVVRVIIGGIEHPIGVIDKKYRSIGENVIIPVKSYQVTGYSESQEEGKEYMRLGMNISFEVTPQQAEVLQPAHG